MLIEVETPEEKYRHDHPGVLRIYDVMLDEFRDATQEDLDRAMLGALHGVTLREQINSVANAANSLHVKWLERFGKDPYGEAA